MSPSRTFFEHTGSRYTYTVKSAEIYVVAAEVKTIGDQPLMEHEVRIVDPDTGKAVTDNIKTDVKGVVRAEVPKNKDYRIEIVDEEVHVAEPPPKHSDPPPWILVCEFVDEAGKPIANEEVEIKAGDTGDGTVATDEHGRLHAPAMMGPCTLKLHDQTFVAHALPAKDADELDHLYRFIVEKKKS